MITGQLADWESVAPTDQPGIRIAFAALASYLQSPPDDGRYEIDGENVFILVQRYVTKAIQNARFENHQRYVDIQVVVTGMERMGVLSTDQLDVAESYDAAKDCALFERPSDDCGLLELGPGDFVVLYPADAHMPGCDPATGPVEVTKFVAKVKVVSGW